MSQFRSICSSVDLFLSHRVSVCAHSGIVWDWIDRKNAFNHFKANFAFNRPRVNMLVCLFVCLSTCLFVARKNVFNRPRKCI